MYITIVASLILYNTLENVQINLSEYAKYF